MFTSRQGGRLPVGKILFLKIKDVWTVTNYRIARGLKRYGFDDLAADLADKTIELSLKHGVSEHHDSATGKALGVDFLGMSCTVVMLMPEGISRKYVLRLKK
jgi:hypothetical protein